MADIKNIQVDGVDYAIKDESARNSIGDLSQLATEAKGDLVSALNELSAGAGSGSGPIQRIESLDESNLLNLRDLETGSYVLYGYFRPFPGASNYLPFDNLLVNVYHVDEGSHLFEFSTANSEVNFIEILVDASAEGGFTYSRTAINMLELSGLIAKLGNLNELTTTEKGSVVGAINEVAASGGIQGDGYEWHEYRQWGLSTVDISNIPGQNYVTDWDSLMTIPDPDYPEYTALDNLLEDTSVFDQGMSSMAPEVLEYCQYMAVSYRALYEAGVLGDETKIAVRKGNCVRYLSYYYNKNGSNMFSITRTAEDGENYAIVTYDMANDKIIDEGIDHSFKYTKKYVDATKVPIPETVAVGQAVVVKTVDQNGKPTEWEAVDMPVGGSGSGGSGVSSWNNLEDRPFDYTKGTSLVEKSVTLTVNEMVGLPLVELTDVLDIIEGNNYVVSFAGEEFICSAKSFQGMLYMGNLSLCGQGENTGEPFFLTPVQMLSQAEGCTIIGNEAGTFEFGAYELTVTKKLNAAFLDNLPSEILTVEIEMSDNGLNDGYASHTCHQMFEAQNNGIPIVAVINNGGVISIANEVVCNSTEALITVYEAGRTEGHTSATLDFTTFTVDENKRVSSKQEFIWSLPGRYNNVDNGYFLKLGAFGPEWSAPATAIADLTAAPTAEDFNNLLAALRAAGYLAT